MYSGGVFFDLIAHMIMKILIYENLIMIIQLVLNSHAET